MCIDRLAVAQRGPNQPELSRLGARVVRPVGGPGGRAGYGAAEGPVEREQRRAAVDGVVTEVAAPVPDAGESQQLAGSGRADRLREMPRRRRSGRRQPDLRRWVRSGSGRCVGRRWRGMRRRRRRCRWVRQARRAGPDEVAVDGPASRPTLRPVVRRGQRIRGLAAQLAHVATNERPGRSIRSIHSIEDVISPRVAHLPLCRPLDRAHSPLVAAPCVVPGMVDSAWPGTTVRGSPVGHHAHRAGARADHSAERGSSSRRSSRMGAACSSPRSSSRLSRRPSASRSPCGRATTACRAAAWSAGCTSPTCHQGRPSTSTAPRAGCWTWRWTSGSARPRSVAGMPSSWTP